MELSIVFCRYEATNNQCQEIDCTARDLKVLGSECVEAKRLNNY
jgi:hypothetical protein